jgi:hypothetical protein
VAGDKAAHLGGEGGEVDEDVGELIVAAVEDQALAEVLHLVVPVKVVFPRPWTWSGGRRD